MYCMHVYVYVYICVCILVQQQQSQVVTNKIRQQVWHPPLVPQASLDAAEFDAVVAGITVLAVELVVPYTDICAIQSVPELHVAHAALEAVDVIEQQQGFNYHGSSATCIKNIGTALG